MNPYEDILHLPHHVSKTRPQMPMSDRAAQFSPFAALTGYDEAIDETARLTDSRLVMSDEALSVLDAKFRLLMEKMDEEPEVKIIYFKPDEKKAGGAYLSLRGVVKSVDEVGRMIVLRDGTRLSMDDILDMEGRIFSVFQ